VFWGLLGTFSVESKKKQWNIFSTIAISLPGYGTYLPKSFNNLTGIEKASSIPSSVGGRNFSNHEIINSAWSLTPSFIIWNVWKERNKRIFKEEKNPPYLMFETILKKLKEIVGSIICNHHNNPPSFLERKILRQLGL